MRLCPKIYIYIYILMSAGPCLALRYECVSVCACVCDGVGVRHCAWCRFARGLVVQPCVGSAAAAHHHLAAESGASQPTH